jgi:hypothetical protein
MQKYQLLSNRASDLSNKFETAIAQSRGTVVIKAKNVTKTVAGLPESFVESHRVKNLPQPNNELEKDDIFISTDYPGTAYV